LGVEGDFYHLHNGELKPLIEPGQEAILKVADSFLVEDGRVRSIDKHFQRFSDWVLQIDSEESKLLKGFFAEVKRLIPRTGRWFPRLEYHAEAAVGNRLFLRLRPAPRKMESITLWTYPDSDPRHNPAVKGPDLSLCQQLRRHANMNGADEAVLLSESGMVSEGALSSLIWFRGDRLCSSDNSTTWLPSITREEVFGIAEAMGLATELESIRPEELCSLPIWALSSLNGIMPVTRWVGLNDSIPESNQLEPFNKRLRMLSQLID